MGSSGNKIPEGISSGPPGERGENGNGVRSGEGIPSNELGVNGDYYVDKVAHTFYGPKTGGVWGSATSLVGPKGEKGLTGPEGPKGEKGATGVAGEKGERGLEGFRGLEGAPGEPGIKGEKGAIGAAGEKGERGEKGEKGSQGIQGEKGLTGATGQKGEEGPRGEKGEAGEKGSTGNTGPAATLGEWKPLTLEAGITNKGEPYSNAEVAKSSIGLVYLRGVVKSSGLLAKEAVLAILPEGYRPAKQQSITANLGATIGNLLILTNGKIEISIGVSLETPFYFDSVFFPLV